MCKVLLKKERDVQVPNIAVIYKQNNLISDFFSPMSVFGSMSAVSSELHPVYHGPDSP